MGRALCQELYMQDDKVEGPRGTYAFRVLRIAQVGKPPSSFFTTPHGTAHG